MKPVVERMAGMRTLVVTPDGAPRMVLVMLHGYAMGPEDLAPFASSMGLSAPCYLPEAPLDAETQGRAWWPIDQERRAQAMARGPRDLYAEHPEGAEHARGLLEGLLRELGRRHPGLPTVVVGFSQGGMLACDTILRGDVVVAGLALLSASRISANEWAPLAGRLAGLPILVSHGSDDPDLGFHAGEALREFCASSGAEVTWVPFAGEHGIPLVVWRALRKWARPLGQE